MRAGIRAHVLSLWMRGLRCLIGKPMFGWHSCPEPSPNPRGSGQGQVGADEGTKRPCPQPHTPGWSLCPWAIPEQEGVAVCFPREHSQEVPAW